MSHMQNNYQPNFYELNKKFLSLQKKFKDWFIFDAIPIWKKYGVDWDDGGFFEALDHESNPIESPRRTRVICRQIYVFTVAYELSKANELKSIISEGYRYLLSKLQCDSGFFAYSYSNLEKANDKKVFLYEQAFVIFVLAALFKHDSEFYFDSLEIAKNLLNKIKKRWFLNQFQEQSTLIDQYHTDPYMHLLEGLILWEEVLENKKMSNQNSEFKKLSDYIVSLVISKFIDKKFGFIAEEYSYNWRKLNDEFSIIEPGHQFEWSWLLIKWSRIRNCTDKIKRFSIELIDFAEKYGIDKETLLVVDSISSEFKILKAESKIWPQCERLKAWFSFYKTKENDSLFELQQCYKSLENLINYLNKPFVGGWIECKYKKNNLDKVVKSSSFYHIVGLLDDFQK